MLCRVSVEDKTDHLTLQNLFNTPLFPCHEPHRPHTPAKRFIQFHLRWSLQIRTVTLHSVLVPWKLGLEILSAANLLKHLLQPKLILLWRKERERNHSLARHSLKLRYGMCSGSNSHKEYSKWSRLADDMVSLIKLQESENQFEFHSGLLISK